MSTAYCEWELRDGTDSYSSRAFSTVAQASAGQPE